MAEDASIYSSEGEPRASVETAARASSTHRRHTKYSSEETNHDVKRHHAVPIARCHQTSQRRDQIVLIGEGDPVSPSPNCCLSWRLNCCSNR